MAYKNIEDARKFQAEYRAKNKEVMYKKAKLYRIKLKQAVLEHYGKECARCGFNDYRALQIDHVNDDGAAERLQLGSKTFSGYRFYKYLIDNNYPTGYQTLCANCNMVKQWEITHTGQ